ncbi:tRNA wybutosine-synthesizing protein 1 -like protein [Trichinella nativa]|uniref:S-adenosyl-L-methionine-dependent tRNA 4-demethylwyosine synthase TYW1 n=1 Tax=Trichinella nativa TaxID=6335 RepID=A0A0V1LIH2_9BILA|nr:tRNA wybutosine-synthesizing protein 1 -like protein [Trichinella nativa]
MMAYLTTHIRQGVSFFVPSKQSTFRKITINTMKTPCHVELYNTYNMWKAYYNMYERTLHVFCPPDVITFNLCESVLIIVGISTALIVMLLYILMKKKEKDKHREEVKIFFASQSGNAQKLAYSLHSRLKSTFSTAVLDLQHYNPEGNLENEQAVCIFIVSTYVDGQCPEKCRWFFKWLEECVSDFRVEKSILSNLRFAVFGLGDKAYGSTFNKVAIKLSKHLLLLKANNILPLYLTEDDNFDHIQSDFLKWSLQLIKYLEVREVSKFSSLHDNKRVSVWRDENENSSDAEDAENSANNVGDIEDIYFTNVTNDSNKIKEMLTPTLRKSLAKQGYHLVGTHSGVKICRWTKSMLRGRGGCYKHTFYGINSHQCMEMTPSLACANKCVFCWRHHSNPVGTEWKWKTDPAEKILSDSLEGHKKMVRQFRGVPGVKDARFEESSTVRHCALSLVGEPIMYPHINELISKMHSLNISTFLVTNAQFPSAIENLIPVTQLYLSVDAASKESLKEIDRPLFRDFWQRLMNSIDILREKKQRTVYRLTLVNRYNMNEVSQYAALINRGQPDFVEVKVGVTYCGDSKDSKITMANVPWHADVVDFVQQLVFQLDDYEIAAEHEHSNCVLIAKLNFKINGQWYTWIDYEKFFSLAERFKKDGISFTSYDYMAKTPDWALFGASQRGFDPEDQRWYRKSKGS